MRGTRHHLEPAVVHREACAKGSPEPDTEHKTEGPVASHRRIQPEEAGNHRRQRHSPETETEKEQEEREAEAARERREERH